MGSTRRRAQCVGLDFREWLRHILLRMAQLPAGHEPRCNQDSNLCHPAAHGGIIELIHCQRICQVT